MHTECELINEAEMCQMEEMSAPRMYWEESEYPDLSSIVHQLYRMGFYLNDVDEKSDTHIYSTERWDCSITPGNGVVRLDYEESTDKLWSEKVFCLKQTSADDITRSIAESVFLKGDDILKKQMRKNKESWNKLYSEYMGSWK